MLKVPTTFWRSSANSTQVIQSVDSVASITEQNNAATQQASASAEEMTAQVEEVVAASQSLSQMADDLQKVVGTFNIDDSGSKVEVSKKAKVIA